jgi:hypothetical protein
MSPDQVGAEGPGVRKSTLDRMSVFEAGGPPYLCR